MAQTVIEAFTKFMRDTVNLDREVTKTARASRDWLLGQIHGFQTKHDDFPLAYDEMDLHFGSFARRTKIRPLDDIDLLCCMKAEGATYTDTAGGGATIDVPDGSRIRGFCHDGTRRLNSRKVINKFVKHLAEVPQYRAAGVSRNGEAAVVDLKSYDWSFDVVPGFFTAPDYLGKTYYLIADGAGDWKKTDPRKDRDRVKEADDRSAGNMLDVVRLVKFWNRRPTMPSVPSYLLECMVVDYYQTKTAEKFVDIEFGPVLDHLRFAVLGAVSDPRGIQSDINTMSWEERQKVSERARQDSQRAAVARQCEQAAKQEPSINAWGAILGAEFPRFG